jgi:hypothetical protein
VNSLFGEIEGFLRFAAKLADRGRKEKCDGKAERER